jgi:hypothetical protein
MARQSQEFCKQNSLRIVTNPPYSLDLALSDCFLFGYMKHYLKAFSYPLEKALIDIIHTVLRGITEIILKAMFKDWMERLIWVAVYQSDYYP